MLHINSYVGNRMEMVQREETALTPLGTICRCRQKPSQSQLIPRRKGSTALPTDKRNIMQALMICLCPCNIKSPCALCTKRRIEELALQKANPPQSIHCLVQQKELRANECNGLYPHAKNNDAHCTLHVCMGEKETNNPLQAKILIPPSLLSHLLQLYHPTSVLKSLFPSVIFSYSFSFHFSVSTRRPLSLDSLNLCLLTSAKLSFTLSFSSCSPINKYL